MNPISGSGGHANTNGMNIKPNNAKNVTEKSQSTTPAWNQNYVQPNSTEVVGSAANLVGRVRKIRIYTTFLSDKIKKFPFFAGTC